MRRGARPIGSTDGLLAGDGFAGAAPDGQPQALSLRERIGSRLSWALGGGLIRASARERMRPLASGVWLGGMFLVSALAFVEVFFALRTHGLASAEEAARNAFRVLFVLQAFVLLLLGTGAVAAGVARQRETGVFDYLRLSPLHPGAKILGVLLGLPVREYAMVGASLPWTVASVLIAGLPPANVLGLYGALLSAAWLYHATGLVAGMVARRPRRAGWMARVLVVALYLLMPRLAGAGATFLGYLTILPAFDALVSDSLGYAAIGAGGGPRSGLFSIPLSPALYTLVVQGWLLAILLYVAWRKWQHSARHAFSKLGGALCVASLLVLVTGSLASYLADPPTPQSLGLVGRHTQSLPVELTWGLAIYAFFALTGTALLVVIGGGTPAVAAVRRGLRRALKSGRTRVSPWDDASPGLAWACGLALLCWAAHLGLLAHVLPEAGLRWNAGAGWHLLFGLLLLGTALQVHAAALAAGGAGVLGLVGLAWVLPPVLGLLLASAFNAKVAGAYAAAVSPAGAFAVAVLGLFEPAAQGAGWIAALERHLGGLLGVALLALWMPALGAEFSLWRGRRRFARALRARRQDVDAAGSGASSGGAGDAHT